MPSTPATAHGPPTMPFTARAPHPAGPTIHSCNQPNSFGDTTAVPPLQAHPGDHLPAGIPMVSMKAKPPTRKERTLPSQTTPRTSTTTSKERQRYRKSKDKKLSRSSRSSRGSIRRGRASSLRPLQGHHTSTRPGSRHHHDTPSHRHEASSKTAEDWIYSWT